VSNTQLEEDTCQRICFNVIKKVKTLNFFARIARAVVKWKKKNWDVQRMVENEISKWKSCRRIGNRVWGRIERLERGYECKRSRRTAQGLTRIKEIAKSNSCRRIGNRVWGKTERRERGYECKRSCRTAQGLTRIWIRVASTGGRRPRRLGFLVLKNEITFSFEESEKLKFGEPH